MLIELIILPWMERNIIKKYHDLFRTIALSSFFQIRPQILKGFRHPPLSLKNKPAFVPTVSLIPIETTTIQPYVPTVNSILRNRSRPTYVPTTSSGTTSSTIRSADTIRRRFNRTKPPSNEKKQAPLSTTKSTTETTCNAISE